LNLPAARRVGRAPQTTVKHPHLLFTVLDVIYALPLLSVQEVTTLDAVTTPRHTSDALIGSQALRFQSIPLVDLGVVLEQRQIIPTRTSCTLVVPGRPSQSNTPIGLAVEAVNGVKSLAPSDMRPPPPAMLGHGQVVAALAASDGGFIPVLDARQIAICPDVDDAVRAWKAAAHEASMPAPE
jgi:chemotaxis signal transduction protein